MTSDTHVSRKLAPTMSIVGAQDVAAARSQLAEHRGLTGRWYRAEAVDRLLDAVTARLAAVMTDLERMRRLNRRLMEIDHRRRFGTLPSGMAAEEITEEAIQRRIEEQEAVDKMLDAAAEQAAAIVREAREHYLSLVGAPGVTAPQPSEETARAERAEAKLREVAAALERWSAFLLERDAADWHLASQRRAELRAAYAAVATIVNDDARR